MEDVISHDELTRFLKDPSRENYLALASKLFLSQVPNYLAPMIQKVRELMERKDYAEAVDVIHAALPVGLLCPRMHYLASMALTALDEPEMARFERLFSMACLRGALATGDGTEAAPYVVTDCTDEYDILGYLRKGSASQSLRRKGDRHYDVFTQDDGSEVWFDIEGFWTGKQVKRAPEG